MMICATVLAVVQMTLAWSVVMYLPDDASHVLGLRSVSFLSTAPCPDRAAVSRRGVRGSAAHWTESGLGGGRWDGSTGAVPIMGLGRTVPLRPPAGAVRPVCPSQAAVVRPGRAGQQRIYRVIEVTLKCCTDLTAAL